MEVSEYHLVLTHKRIFRWDRLFHLQNHVCLGINCSDIRKDFSANRLIISIREAAIFPCIVLHIDFMSVLRKFTYTRRSHAYTVLIVLNLAWNSNLHSRVPFVIKVNSNRVLQQI